MFFLIKFVFFSIIIKSINSICNSTEFYPCACCDPIYHHCVHDAANRLSRISSYSAFKIFNPTYKLDTSTYCCVSKDVDRSQIKNDNITLFRRYCKKTINLNNSLDSIINTIISSCDPISKRCYDIKNPIIPPLLPLPKRPSDLKILLPQREKQEMTTRISSIIIDEDENKIEEENRNKNLTENKQQLEEVTISIWVPEKILPENEEDNYNTIINENTNRAIRQFQSIWFFILISIIISN